VCTSKSFFLRYDEAAPAYKPYRQKDGALLAVGALCDKLKQTEPYKSQLEQMLVQHVFPEFRSQVGHLRAKVCIFFLRPYLSVLQLMHIEISWLVFNFANCNLKIFKFENSKHFKPLLTVQLRNY
jgi:hypothetical protein